MDISKFANIEGVTGRIDGLSPSKGTDLKGLTQGPSFDDALKKVDTKTPALQGLQPTEKPELVFSKHAIERMRSRGIGMDPTRMERLETAFNKADAKGSKNTLVLMDDSAFIMSVKNKTIVTAMDKGALKENLFTNIDSTILV